MKTPVKKPDGEMRPRLESWEYIACHLRRFVSPRLGKKLPSEVTKHDIATLIERHRRGQVRRSFGQQRPAHAQGDLWPVQLGSGSGPRLCDRQPLRQPAEARPGASTHPRPVRGQRSKFSGTASTGTTCLGTARPASRSSSSWSPCCARRNCSAHSAASCSTSRRHPRFDVPLKRVKKRRVIQQPLSDLAVEIIREALEDGKEHVFASPLGDQPMNRKVMATALRGTKRQGQGENARHLRAARLEAVHAARFAPDGGDLGGDLGFDDAWIAKCLDHAASKKSEQIVPSVTGKVYNHSKRMKEKRAVLDGVAAELRRIIGLICVSDTDRN